MGGGWWWSVNSGPKHTGVGSAALCCQGLGGGTLLGCLNVHGNEVVRGGAGPGEENGDYWSPAERLSDLASPAAVPYSTSPPPHLLVLPPPPCNGLGPTFSLALCWRVSQQPERRRRRSPQPPRRPGTAGHECSDSRAGAGACGGAVRAGGRADHHGPRSASGHNTGTRRTCAEELAAPAGPSGRGHPTPPHTTTSCKCLREAGLCRCGGLEATPAADQPAANRPAWRLVYFGGAVHGLPPRPARLASLDPAHFACGTCSTPFLDSLSQDPHPLPSTPPVLRPPQYTDGAYRVPAGDIVVQIIGTGLDLITNISFTSNAGVGLGGRGDWSEFPASSISPSIPHARHASARYPQPSPPPRPLAWSLGPRSAQLPASISSAWAGPRLR